MTHPRLERNPDLVERQVAEETFLSEVGQFVWSRADGTRGVPEIVAEVLSEFDVSEETARAEVAEFVSQLKSYGLMTEVGN
jgi:hypothetical protein